MALRTLFQRHALIAAVILAGLGCSNETPPSAEPKPTALRTEFPAESETSAEAAPKAPVKIPPHPKVESTPALEKTLPALRFSGATMLHIFQRIAGEAGVRLGIDAFETSQTSASNPSGAFTRRFVEVDLNAGTVGQALQQLYEQAGGFTYAGKGGGIYIKEGGFRPEDPVALLKQMPAQQYAGTFANLHSWLFTQAKMVVKTPKTPGTPVWKRVDFETTEPLSIVDFLMRFGKEAGTGWLLLRRSQPNEANRKNPAFAISEIQLLAANDSGAQTSGVFNRTSVLGTFVDIAELTGTPICIVDWAHHSGASLPSLGGHAGPHGNSAPAQEQLKKLAESYPGNSPPFRWQERDGMILVRSVTYDQNAAVAGTILQEPLKGGSFSGSLGELARWINQNHQVPGKGDLQSGEIFPNDPVATLEIEEGATVEEVLLAFGAKTGTCWTLSRRLVALGTAAADIEDTQDGAYLLPLEFWHRNGLQNLGSRNGPPAASVSEAAPPAGGSGNP